ncbi:MAG: hypothetical protein ACPG09_06780 [Paracoccaceae bacterium]
MRHATLVLRREGGSKAQGGSDRGSASLLVETVGCLALRGGIALSTGRCGVSPLEGVMKNALARLQSGEGIPHPDHTA